MYKLNFQSYFLNYIRAKMGDKLKDTYLNK